MKAIIKNLSIITFFVIYLYIDSDITNILYLTAPIISRKFNIKGNVNKDKLYHNLYHFFNRLEDKFIKIMVKISITDATSKKRLISITKFIYVNTLSKYDTQSFINHALFKFNKY